MYWRAAEHESYPHVLAQLIGRKAECRRAGEITAQALQRLFWVPPSTNRSSWSYALAATTAAQGQRSRDD
jgi:hypothetical protein